MDILQGQMQHEQQPEEEDSLTRRDQGQGQGNLLCFCNEKAKKNRQD